MDQQELCRIYADACRWKRLAIEDRRRGLYIRAAFEAAEAIAALASRNYETGVDAVAEAVRALAKLEAIPSSYEDERG